MGAGNIYLSREGYEKLRKELKHLKTVRRRELSEEIGRARELGDISENAEYDAAKDAQGLNEKRIAELEGQLSRAQILDDSRMAKDEALLGATVRLKDVDSGEEIEYMLVAELEADFPRPPIGERVADDKISIRGGTTPEFPPGYFFA